MFEGAVMKKRIHHRNPLLMKIRGDLASRTSWKIGHMDPSGMITKDWLSVAIRDGEDRIHQYSIKEVEHEIIISGPVPLTLSKDTEQLSDLIHLHLLAHSRFI
jgi:hypothetical protein